MSVSNSVDDTSYDYIVVGGGSAGSAVTARLSESGRYSVLLLEAGEDDSWLWLRVPLGAGYVLLSDRSMWRFYTNPEPNLAKREMFWPRGRVLGGSSTINGMLWVRGEPAEYDAWRDNGCPGWGYEDVLPFLKRAESYAEGDDTTRGKQGPVHISLSKANTLGDAFHQACVEAGIPATPDYNGKQYEGVGFLQTNTKNGLRHGGREAYLRPAKGRENLHIRTGARVHRIRVENGRAVGVEYRYRQGPALRTRPQRGDHQCRRNPDAATAGAFRHRRSRTSRGTRYRQCRSSARCRRELPGPSSYPNFVRVLSADHAERHHGQSLRKAWMGLQYLTTRGGHMAVCTATVHALAKTDPSLDRPDVKIQVAQSER